jgi:hypothetical protein
MSSVDMGNDCEVGVGRDKAIGVGADDIVEGDSPKREECGDPKGTTTFEWLDGLFLFSGWMARDFVNPLNNI